MSGPEKCLYKQIALRPSDHPNAVLAVYDPKSERVRYFVSRVLPFGATGAVMGFNRMAVKSQVVMDEFLDILGWEVSLEAKSDFHHIPSSQSWVWLST